MAHNNIPLSGRAVHTSTDARRRWSNGVIPPEYVAGRLGAVALDDLRGVIVAQGFSIDASFIALDAFALGIDAFSFSIDARAKGIDGAARRRT
jgi:hypothetical protein